MSEFESIDEVAEALGDGGPLAPDVEYKTVGELVDALVRLGNTDEVFARHDDHLGLKSDLSNELLQSSLRDAGNPKFEADVEAIVKQANIIIPLANRDLSEDDKEEIREDRRYRGDDPDED